MTTDPTAETARTLLYRHGLPEDVIDGVLCLHAQELAALQRADAQARHDRSYSDNRVFELKGARTAADLIDPTKGAAASAVVAPPTNRAELRDRIADAIRQAACPGDCGKTEEECAKERIQPFVWHHGRLAVVEGSPEQFADAVLPVLGEQTDRAAVLLWAADHFDRMGRTVLAASQVRDALRRLAVEAHDTGAQQQVPTDEDVVEAHRLALSFALGLGSGAPWDAIRDRAAELSGADAEPAPVAQQPAAEGDGPRCRYCGTDCANGRSYDGGGLYACGTCSNARAARNRAEQQPAAADDEETPRCVCGHTRGIHTGSNLFCAVPKCMCSRYTGVPRP